MFRSFAGMACAIIQLLQIRQILLAAPLTQTVLCVGEVGTMVQGLAVSQQENRRVQEAILQVSGLSASGNINPASLVIS